MGSFDEYGQSFLFDLLGFTATWWLQAAILSAAGISAAALLGRRALQSVVYRVTLCAVLLCPAATQLLALSGVSLFTIDLQSLLVNEHSFRPSELAVADATALSGRILSNDMAPPAAEPWTAQSSPDVSPFNPAFDAQQPASSNNSSQTGSVIEPDLTAGPSASMFHSKPSVAAPSLLLLGFALVAAWLLGTLLLSAKLIGDLSRSRSLRRHAARADELAERVCREVAAQLQVQTPEVKATPFLSSPCLLGHWRPAVLLPEEIEPATYHQVFLHELAHLRRSDWLWNLIGRGAHAILWCQPLLWWLQRRILIVSEEICDDYVLEHGCSREGYLRQLVDIAERSLPKPRVAGVSMVGFRTNLGKRASRILDTSRVLSTQAGRLFAGITLAATLVVTTAVALFQIGQTANVSAQDPVATADTTSSTGNASVDQVRGESSSTAAQPANTARSYTGVVLDPAGNQAAGALVAMIATRLHGQAWPHSQTLAEATTDETGRYEIRLTGVSEKTHRDARLVMRTENSGIAWQPIDLEKATRDLGNTQLSPQQLIQVRLVDLEGNPAANQQLQLQSITRPPAAQPNQVEGLWLHKLDRVPKAWLAPPQTDADGLLTIRNIAAENGVVLHVQASDQFAPQDLALNTGRPEERGERDGTYRSLVKNMLPGEMATIPLAPAQVFEGTVLLGKDGPPAANSRIEMWASQQEFGSMLSIEGTTDDQGRFRMTPYPGIRFGIVAYPPDGSPYQIARLNDLRWTSSDQTKKIQIVLERGSLARGQVVDADSGQPLAHASVQYHPTATNPNDKQGIVTGWQGIRKTDERGEFEIPVLPGPGWLLVHASESQYILREKTERTLDFDKPGGRRVYAHAFVEIDPSIEGVFQPIQVELQKGRSVTLEVVDPDGQPVEEAIVVSRLKVFAIHGGTWRGQNPDKVHDGRIVFDSLVPDTDYPIYVLDPQRKLGAVATINSNQPTTKVALQPCGSAEFHFYDAEEQPRAGAALGLSLVVTPGPNYWTASAQQRNSAMADEELVPNIDRLNHEDNVSGSDGRHLLNALIPGATYRYTNDGTLHEFVAMSGETIDLGDVKQEQ